MKYYLLIATTIVLFGVSVFFRKLAIDRIHPYQLQIVAGAVYAIEIPIWLYLISKSNITGYNTTGVIFAALCIVTYVIAAVMFGLLLKSSNSTGQLTVMIAMNPIVTFLLSILFLGEDLTTKKLIASLLALSGLILFNL